MRRLAADARRVAAVCPGATVLAVPVCWGAAAPPPTGLGLPARGGPPDVTVGPAPLFVRDGNVYTSAGVTSALDLSLPLVEKDHGASVARPLARYLVVYLQRPGNQAQVSVFLTTHLGDAPSRDVRKREWRQRPACCPQATFR